MSATMPRCCGSRTPGSGTAGSPTTASATTCSSSRRRARSSDPGCGTRRATIGHASSLDLVDWDVHADALLPDAERWDDLALWTGSVVRGDDGVWRMYYTALSAARAAASRTSGSAWRSHDDLITWRRVGDRPLIEPDPRWYRTLDDDRRSETWRDPFVFADPDGDGWHMLITARDPDAPRLLRRRARPRAQRRPRAPGSSSRR